MRTTIDLPDPLFRQVKARAALEGRKLKELLAEYVEQGLRRPSPPPGSTSIRRSAPPVIIPARGIPIAAVTGEDLRRMETGEDETRHARSA